MKNESTGLIECECGCQQEALYLCTGYDFDSSCLDAIGQKFEDQPCCEHAMHYLGDSAIELGLPPIIVVPIHFTERVLGKPNFYSSNPTKTIYED